MKFLSILLFAFTIIFLSYSTGKMIPGEYEIYGYTLPSIEQYFNLLLIFLLTIYLMIRSSFKSFKGGFKKGFELSNKVFDDLLTNHKEKLEKKEKETN